MPGFFGINIEIGSRGEDEVTIDEGGLWIVKTGKGDDTVIMDTNIDVDLQDDNLIALINTGQGDDTIILHEADEATGYKKAIVSAGSGHDTVSAINMDAMFVHTGSGNDMVLLDDVNSSQVHMGSGHDILQYAKDVSLQTHWFHDHAHMGSGNDIVDYSVAVNSLGMAGDSAHFMGGEAQESDASSLVDAYLMNTYPSANFGAVVMVSADATLSGDTFIITLDEFVELDLAELEAILQDLVDRMALGKTVSLAEFGLDITLKHFENIIVQLPGNPATEDIVQVDIDSPADPIDTGGATDIVDYSVDVDRLGEAGGPSFIDAGEGTETNIIDALNNYIDSEFGPDARLITLQRPTDGSGNNIEDGDLLVLSYDTYYQGVLEHFDHPDFPLSSADLEAALEDMANGLTVDLNFLGIDLEIANFEAIAIVAESRGTPPATEDIVQVSSDTLAADIDTGGRNDIVNLFVATDGLGVDGNGNLLDGGEGEESLHTPAVEAYIAQLEQDISTQTGAAFSFDVLSVLGGRDQIGDTLILTLDELVAIPTITFQTQLDKMNTTGLADLNFFGLDIDIANFESIIILAEAKENQVQLNSDTVDGDWYMGSENDIMDLTLVVDSLGNPGSVYFLDGGEGNESDNEFQLETYLNDNYFSVSEFTELYNAGFGGGDTLILAYDQFLDLDPSQLDPIVEDWLIRMDNGEVISLLPFGVNLEIANFEHIVVLEPPNPNTEDVVVLSSDNLLDDVDTGQKNDIVDLTVVVAGLGSDGNGVTLDGGEGDESFSESFVLNQIFEIETRDLINYDELIVSLGNNVEGDTLILTLDQLVPGLEPAGAAALFQSWIDQMNNEALPPEQRVVSMLPFGLDINIANFENIVLLTQPDPKDIVLTGNTDNSTSAISTGDGADIVDYLLVLDATDNPLSGGPSTIDGGQGNETDWQTELDAYLADRYALSEFSSIFELGQTTTGDVLVFTWETLAELEAQIGLGIYDLDGASVLAALAAMDAGLSVDLNDPNGPLYLGVDAIISNFEALAFVVQDSANSDIVQVNILDQSDPITTKAGSDIIEYSVDVSRLGSLGGPDLLDGGESAESNMLDLYNQYQLDFYNSESTNVGLFPAGGFSGGLSDGDIFVLAYDSLDDVNAHFAAFPVAANSFIAAADLMESGGSVDLNDPNGPLYLGIDTVITGFEAIAILVKPEPAPVVQVVPDPDNSSETSFVQGPEDNILDFIVKLELPHSFTADGGEGNENWEAVAAINDYVDTLFAVSPVFAVIGDSRFDPNPGDVFILRYNSETDFQAHWGEDLNAVADQLQGLLDQMDAGDSVNLGDVQFATDIGLDVTLSNYEYFAFAYEAS